MDIIRPEITVYNDREKPIPIDIQLLLTHRFYAKGTFQMACEDLCDISQASTSRYTKQVSEAIAGLKNNYITFPEGDMLAFSHLIQQRRTNALTSLQQPYQFIYVPSLIFNEIENQTPATHTQVRSLKRNLRDFFKVSAASFSGHSHSYSTLTHTLVLIALKFEFE